MSEQHQPDLIDEACEWAAAIALNNFSELERRRFAVWIGKSPDHLAAYRQTCTAFDHPSVTAALAEVAPPIASNNVSVLVQHRDPVAVPWAARVRAMSSQLVAGALAATVLIAIWSISLLQDTGSESDPGLVASVEYSTARGEIKEFALPDGSVAMLGGRSVINVAYAADERRVTLLEGEGYFTVVADSSRPFTVDADRTIVQAIGTAFDVRLNAGSVRVDVVEGVVRVESPTPSGAVNHRPGKSGKTLLVNAGERLVFEPEDGLTKRRAAPNEQLAAWRTGRLQYIDEELSLIVADANRYYAGDIKIVSDKIQSIKVNAIIPISSIEHIFKLLAQQVPISVLVTDQGDILLSASKN